MNPDKKLLEEKDKKNIFGFIQRFRNHSDEIKKLEEKVAKGEIVLQNNPKPKEPENKPLEMMKAFFNVKNEEEDE